MDDAKTLVPRRDAFKINGLEFSEGRSPVEGTVRWDTVRSLFNGAMLALAVSLGPLFFSWPALAAFLVLSFFTLCCGHSVGFHRRMIHRSFKCPKLLEYIMIYLGAAVGMGHPDTANPAEVAGPALTDRHPGMARLAQQTVNRDSCPNLRHSVQAPSRLGGLSVTARNAVCATRNPAFVQLITRPQLDSGSRATSRFWRDQGARPE